MKTKSKTGGHMSDGELTYHINQHFEDGSYWAEVVELPGCFAAGDTLEELNESLEEAIGIWHSTPDMRVTVTRVEGDKSKVIEQKFLVGA